MITFIKFKTQKYGFKAENIRFNTDNGITLVTFDRIKKDNTIERMTMPLQDFESITETDNPTIEEEKEY